MVLFRSQDTSGPEIPPVCEAGIGKALGGSGFPAFVPENGAGARIDRAPFDRFRVETGVMWRRGVMWCDEA